MRTRIFAERCLLAKEVSEKRTLRVSCQKLMKTEEKRDRESESTHGKSQKIENFKEKNEKMC